MTRPLLAVLAALSTAAIAAPGIASAHTLTVVSPETRPVLQQIEKPVDADVAAIRQLVTDFYESFSRHDAHATTMTFAEEGDFTNMSGVHVHGRKAIEERFVALFTGNLRAARRTDTVRSIQFLTPQVALVDADTLIVGTRTADGAEGAPRKGLMIVVVTKADGRWLIGNFHEAEFPPPRNAR